jgi:hypothetical protein
MRRYVLILCLPFFIWTGCRKDDRGAIQNLAQNHKATVFTFLAPDCPLSQNYALTLNTLYMQFKPKNVGFYGVIAGSGFESKDVNEYISNYKIGFPVLFDQDWKITDFFKATTTPETFAVNTEGTVFYRGAIDNWAAALGQHREVITRHFLLDALNSFLEGRNVEVKQTEAVGCFIERKG